MKAREASYPHSIAARAWLERAAARIAQASGWRRRGLAFAAGAVSTLAFAPFFVWPVLFLTFPVLVWQLDGAAAAPRPVRAAFAAAWWFGFGYFFAGLFWIGEAFLIEAEIFAWLLPFAVTALPAGLALFWGTAGATSAALAGKLELRDRKAAPLHAPLARIMILAVCLSATEWLRGHILTGFPWDPPGVALTYPLPLMQSAGVLGIYGLTLWSVLIFASPLVLWAAAVPEHKPGAARLMALASALPLMLAFVLGSWHLSAPRSPDVPGVKLRIVQPSIPQREKWMADKQAGIFQTHLELSRRNPHGELDGLDGITHVIWPEAAMPFGPLNHPEALDAIAKLLGPGRHLLAGALRAEPDPTAATGQRAYNSLMVFGGGQEGGRLEALYDKVHLVPFGEYLPFQATLEAIGLQSLTRQRGGFSSGPTPKPLLAVQGLPPVSPLICYEAIFPDEAAPGPERPGLIVIVTNDGWFGTMTGPQQHFHQARLRAVEQGMTVVRSANNGISALIDPEGRIVGSTLKLNERGVIDTGLPERRTLSPFAVSVDVVFLLSVLLFLFFVCLLRRMEPTITVSPTVKETPG